MTPPVWTPAEHRFMQEALALAHLARKKALPNPAVGAVIVKRNRIIARGSTSVPGGPHAEINALRQAGKGARGSRIFVTLEPCSHFGRTPPCAEALIRAGVKEVVAAVGDPNPLVKGRGFRMLKKAGIAVRAGLEKGPVSRFYQHYNFFALRGRPRIILKIAESLDGSINAFPGQRTAITCARTGIWTHKLRNGVDAILVGGQTFRADNPDLTPRLVRDGFHHVPVPILLSASGNLPHGHRLLLKNRKVKPLILTRHPEKLPPWSSVELIRSNRVDPSELLEIFCRKGFHSVLIEGGADVLAQWLKTPLWDVFYLLTGNRELPGGEKWRSRLPRNWHKRLRINKLWHIGSDTLKEFHPENPER